MGRKNVGIKGQDGNKDDCARKHGMRLDLCYEMAKRPDSRAARSFVSALRAIT
uniref:Uncharacterized protein n=1 Tax=Utricularia reniformis TaxID=192314 RepID=A0A1Y0B0X1_9LAMI|nr:hypothetical protein AEK19_MT0787 [Utricularia reniformis]ART31028.1 hypothetical protein AEK19_MT0787 [Utricularia reniformis]